MQLHFPETADAIRQGLGEKLLEVGSPTDSGDTKAFYSLISLREYGSWRPLRLLVRHTSNQTHAELRGFRDRAFAIGAALAVLVLGVAVVIARRLTNPMAQLSSAIEDYGRTGSLGALPLTARDEIGVLARGFHNVFHQMQEVAASREAAFREVEHKRLALDEHAIVAITDVRGTITYVNDKFCKLSGYSRQELLGKNHRLLNSGKHSREFFKQMYRTIADGRPWHGELCNRSKNGELYWVDTTITPYMGKNGKPQRYIAIRTDITGRIRGERELIDARDAAQSAALQKASFLASMSHEIRTPMNGVLGMLSLLLDTQLDDRQRHQAMLAQSSAEALLSLINDILDYSKVDAGKLELESLEFHLLDVLADIVESLAITAHNSRVGLILDTTEVGQDLVRGDPSRLRQIFTNLIGNAIKFAPNTNVYIGAKIEREGGSLRFAGFVRDRGIGIPADKLGALFAPFTQVDSSTTRKFGGTGLGLAIVKQLCELMGGDIGVTSTPGSGSCFQFHVKLDACSSAGADAPPIHGQHVLVVDDCKERRNALRSQLERWGAEVSVAGDYASARASLGDSSNKPVRVALIDMDVPDDGANRLARHIASSESADEIACVAMATMDSHLSPSEYRRGGFVTSFVKPAVHRGLMRSLAQATGAVNPSSEPKPSATATTTRDGQLVPPNARILVVEDNQINQKVAVGVLRKLGLEKVDVVANGYEALAALERAEGHAPFAVVLMDCQMPELDGYGASRKIRAGDAGATHQDVPIIAMTANAMKGDDRACYDAGMNDYITKPIDPSLLGQKLRRWLTQDPARAVGSG
ncbi:MAG: response regulator [Myxococcales bacterium]|nr:response regulator [Myxococcales bacterium]